MMSTENVQYVCPLRLLYALQVPPTALPRFPDVPMEIRCFTLGASCLEHPSVHHANMLRAAVQKLPCLPVTRMLHLDSSLLFQALRAGSEEGQFSMTIIPF